MTDKELILLGKAYLIYTTTTEDSEAHQLAFEIMGLLSNKIKDN